MGSVCCCLGMGDYTNPNSCMNRICCRCFLEMFTAIFQRGEMRSLPSSNQGTSTMSQDSSLSEMYRSPPRPLPYDADPRCFRPSKREKGSSHSHEEREPLRRDIDNAHVETISTGKQWNGSDVVRSKECLSGSSVKLSLPAVSDGVAYVYSSSEDEDVCPTCLEEYTPENPKIMTKCYHHYHLGCIYEWMERSETCPVCGKVMEFDETT
ncbi:hypothetical protein GIB67_001810 [Kingdonia uniflora]|uniref:RING-type E3 ubiquitin transferase n=1 Tax=Kingdonia uniflora TaxID=39325 RepID=A0A7J7LC03_9MAGN|nr:hypothetical protein GIB67_001810 [Kingdonia uniflora]